MARKQRKTESELYTRDSVHYTIRAEPCGKGYIGKWMCETCFETDGPSSVFRSASEAFLHTKINLGPHHSSKHQPREGSQQ